VWTRSAPSDGPLRTNGKSAGARRSSIRFPSLLDRMASLSPLSDSDVSYVSTRSSSIALPCASYRLLRWDWYYTRITSGRVFRAYPMSRLSYLSQYSIAARLRGSGGEEGGVILCSGKEEATGMASSVLPGIVPKYRADLFACKIEKPRGKTPRLPVARLGDHP
jgi:hypothetical protein